jgi:hypothetical protein
MKIYYINLEEAEGMLAISLVADPAVQRNFYCFNEEKPLKLQLANEAEHKITGVVCLADTPIYRRDNDKGEYYIIFTKETIKAMVDKYAKNGLFNSVNLEHNPENFVNSVFMVECFIKDVDKGISPTGFEDVPNGSLFCTFKVEDEKLWNEIVNTDHFNGFSLEGIFNLSQYKLTPTRQPESNKNAELSFDEEVTSLLDELLAK